MAQLHDLVSFLDKNSSLELSLSQRPGSDSHALLKEKQSLQWVRGLLGDSLQLLGLWSIVVDHQVRKGFLSFTFAVLYVHWMTSQMCL